MAEMELDLTRDFAEVKGDPVNKYIQGDFYFGRDGRATGKTPEAFRAGRVNVAKNVAAQKAAQQIAEARAAERMARAAERIEAQVGPATQKPASVVTAAKENAAAAAAEESAE